MFIELTGARMSHYHMRLPSCALLFEVFLLGWRKNGALPLAFAFLCLFIRSTFVELALGC